MVELSILNNEEEKEEEVLLEFMKDYPHFWELLL